MSEVITELSESELPDYVNALLEQNRELREENARLKALWDSIPTVTDYVEKRHGGKI